MSSRFVCLANSYKEGGRCVAGILLDKKNNPIKEKGRPKWVRPVSSLEHGEIATPLVEHVKTLTIVEIDSPGPAGHGYQSENVLFNERSIREVGKFSRADLADLCENAEPHIFLNKGRAIHEDQIHRLDHSLMLVRATDFEVLEMPNEHKPGTTQIKLAFDYNAIPYEFAITDPVFLKNYRFIPHYLDNVKAMYLTLSVGVVWHEFHHKLVAGVLRAA